MNLFDKVPKVSGNVFVAPNATVIGDVEVGENTSIWYGAVIRGTIPILCSLIVKRYFSLYDLFGKIFVARQRPPLTTLFAFVGDVNFIRIGANATIGDRAVIHVGRFGSKVSKDAPTLIGNNTVIGTHLP
jgi:carbonic anhydrase/acetyltransferase-like protein (isoleucine patch superfamily)